MRLRNPPKLVNREYDRKFINVNPNLRLEFTERLEHFSGRFFSKEAGYLANYASSSYFNYIYRLIESVPKEERKSSHEDIESKLRELENKIIELAINTSF